MPDLLSQIAQTIRHHAMIPPGARIVVAVSGGADSLTLLDVLHQLSSRVGWTLHVATLDHGMRGAVGAADAAFVRETAQMWGLPVTVGRADVPGIARTIRAGLEDAARQARYTFLLRVARQVGASAIALGHTQDDQAETVLMHLIRGSGLRGLRGMLPVAPLTEWHVLREVEITFDPPFGGEPAAPGLWPVLVRPLLETPRAAIEAYVDARELTPLQDASNIDTAYLRNRVRHEILPLLAEVNPGVRAALAQTAAILRADAELIERAGEQALARALGGMWPDALALDRGVWADLLLAEKRLVLRAAVGRLRPDLHDLAFVHVESAVEVADAGEVGAAVALPGALVVRVDYAHLLVATVEAVSRSVPGLDAPALEPDTAPLAFTPTEVFRATFGAWTFEAGPLPPGADVSALHADPLAAALVARPGAMLRLRTRRRGDRFAPRGLGGRRQKLADTLINMKVPASWRDRIPLLTVDDQITWFVAPTPTGVRGRVAAPFALDERRDDDRVMFFTCWKREES